MTPADIIKLSLKTCGILGVGQTPSAEDANDAFMVLNAMLGQWARRRWLVYHLLDMPLTLTGATSYTVGPGGSINMVRPDRIEAAYLRQLTQAAPYQVDTPLAVVSAEEDWASIPNKQQPGFPQAVFLDSGYPTGTIYLWPVPPAALYEAHLIFKSDLVAFTSLTQAVSLPPEYLEAIRYNLAARLLIEYDKPQRSDIVALALSSLNTIRMSNTQIPQIDMPPGMPGGWGSGGWNVFSGRYN